MAADDEEAIETVVLVSRSSMGMAAELLGSMRLEPAPAPAPASWMQFPPLSHRKKSSNDEPSLALAMDRTTPFAMTTLRMDAAAMRAILMCRHARLGEECAGSMRRLPNELWRRIFECNEFPTPIANAVTLTQPASPGRPARVISFPCGIALAPAAPQGEVYGAALGALVESVLAGYSGSLLAYGASGTGKSERVEGSAGSAVGEEGLLQTAVRHVYACIGAGNAPKFSAFAVAQRKVYDLLGSSPSSTEEGSRPPHRLSLQRGAGPAGERTDPQVVGLAAHTPRTAAECLTLIDTARGARMRLAEAEEGLAAVSALERCPICDEGGGIDSRIDCFWRLELLDGTLTVVQLAGCERRRPGRSRRCERDECLLRSERLQSAKTPPAISPRGGGEPLAAVIGALTSERSAGASADARRHVPYRESPTTELLTEALGGSSRTVWLATVSAEPEDLEETAATLRLTSRVRGVRNRPRQSEAGGGSLW